jgi:5-methyltetrahydropteroyltriglutamate--homocysteine methyltransferase
MVLATYIEGSFYQVDEIRIHGSWTIS